MHPSESMHYGNLFHDLNRVQGLFCAGLRYPQTISKLRSTNMKVMNQYQENPKPLKLIYASAVSEPVVPSADKATDELIKSETSALEPAILETADLNKHQHGDRVLCPCCGHPATLDLQGSEINFVDSCWFTPTLDGGIWECVFTSCK